MKHVNTKELKEMTDVKKLLEYYEFEQISEDGRGWVTCICPYHKDTNPSFGMRKDNTLFNCWSCKETGDAIKLVMDMENITFKEAITKLSGIVGYDTTGDSCLEYLEHFWKSGNSSKDNKTDNPIVYNNRILSLHRLAMDVSKKLFKGSDAEKYLKARGFSEEVCEKFDLGYMPEIFSSGLSFYDVARNFKFTKEEINVAGYGDETYSRFKNRLVFPIKDQSGNILGMSARSLSESNVPKYMATPNSEYYKKGHLLYGLSEVRKNELITLVEGNLDYIRLRSLDINALAQLGSSLTNNQCDLLKSLTNVVHIMADGDDAGRKLSFKNVLPLVSRGLYVGVVKLPFGEDPDTFFRSRGKDEALKSIVNDKLTAGALEYYIDYAKNNRYDMFDVIIDCLTAVGKIKDKSVFDNYVEDLSKLTGYDTTTLKSEIKKVSYV